MDELITIQEAATLRTCARGTVYYAIKQRQLKTVTLYGKKLITRESLEKWEPAPERKARGRKAQITKAAKR